MLNINDLNTLKNMITQKSFTDCPFKITLPSISILDNVAKKILGIYRDGRMYDFTV